MAGNVYVSTSLLIYEPIWWFVLNYSSKTAFHISSFQNDIDSAVALTDCLTLVGQDAYNNLVAHCVDDLRV